MILRRFLLFFTTLWAGGLAIEVCEYHQLAALARDRWAVVPQISAPLLAFAAFLVLTWPKRGTTALLVVACGISIVVGLIGPVLHYASRGVGLSAVLTPGSWLGEPPPLAPLEFAAVGLLGLVPVAWRDGGASLVAPTGRIAATCEGVAALLCLVAAGFAIQIAPAPATALVWVALGVGTLGYLVELTSKPVLVAIAFGALAVVVVLGVTYFRARTAAPQAAAPVSTTGGSTVALGAQVYQSNGCAGCHVIASAGGAVGPNLTHIGAVRTRAQLEAPIVHGLGTMPGYPNLTPAALNELLNYLQSLK
ncbi:MAG TPA: cytochrome c [bacterium]|nr:cytochrome c [bacterium]